VLDEVLEFPEDVFSKYACLFIVAGVVVPVGGWSIPSQTGGTGGGWLRKSMPSTKAPHE
jgi:hypothetical protein